MILYLTYDQVIAIHDAVLLNGGGLPGIRSRAELESAVDAPRACLFGNDMYPSFAEKCAVYLYHIIKNHPFNDANKRTAYLCFFAFCRENGFCMDKYDQICTENLCVLIAAGSIQKSELIEMLKVQFESIKN
jgi:death-on-curing protein